MNDINEGYIAEDKAKRGPLPRRPYGTGYWQYDQDGRRHWIQEALPTAPHASSKSAPYIKPVKKEWRVKEEREEPTEELPAAAEEKKGKRRGRSERSDGTDTSQPAARQVREKGGSASEAASHLEAGQGQASEEC